MSNNQLIEDLKHKIYILKLRLMLQLKMLELARYQSMLPTENGKKMYQAAVPCLGIDASPEDLADDELGCAETWHQIYRKAFGEYFIADAYERLSTRRLKLKLDVSVLFMKVTDPLPGDTVLSATGFGGTKAVPVGHVGVMGENGIIMSNDSRDGTFDANYTLDSWRRRYVEKGNFAMDFYRRKDIIN